MKDLIHYGLHLIFPLFIALFVFKKTWLRVYLIFLLSMLVDLDHLAATPIFDPDRCSIGFHPLHSQWAIIIYFLMLLWRGNRDVQVLGLALILHMGTDLIDCYL